MRVNPNIFYAKILLFGEYSVLLDSMGLSIPYTHFRGELSFLNEDKYTDRNYAHRSNLELRKFLDYLRNSSNGFDRLIDLKAMEKDLEKGIYFESTIPEGYGLGSSGALCAAVYKRYGKERIGNRFRLQVDQILQLKKVLSRLESGFHGTSSGLDPLNSYLKVPLLIRNREDIQQVSLPGKKFGKNSAIFLVNTGSPGNTAPLVKKFMEKCEAPGFLDLMQKELIPLNNQCVEQLVEGRVEDFFTSLNSLSAFQLQHFSAMIPTAYRQVWAEGLEADKFWMKLCGSGGGGFLLGFTRSVGEIQTILERRGLAIVPVYQNG